MKFLSVNSGAIFLLCFASLSIIFNACKHLKDGPVTTISAHNGQRSHNMGENCMDCHRQRGEGSEAGWFNVAGTVYDTQQSSAKPNATIKLYSGPDGSGTLMYTIDADALGNFYTTKYINFQPTLYAVVESDSGSRFMSAALPSGACNSCHGISTACIQAD